MCTAGHESQSGGEEGSTSDIPLCLFKPIIQRVGTRQVPVYRPQEYVFKKHCVIENNYLGDWQL